MTSDDPAPRLAARVAAGLRPSGSELVGLVVLLLGALTVTALLVVQAAGRPDPGRAAADEAFGRSAAPGAVAETGPGPGEVGAAVDALGSLDGPGPGGDPAHEDGSAGNGAASAVDGDQPQDPGEVVAHVSGAVGSPGVVVLAAGARVADAVTAAGGLLDDALPERVNLARIVVDGEQIHVPREGDEDLPPIGGGGAVAGGAGGGGTVGGSGVGADGRGPVDLNRASAAELETLPGIGPSRAAAIVRHREEHGPFRVPGDLRDVPGIGEATFQSLADLVVAG
jgi:competence protein ComEA